MTATLTLTYKQRTPLGDLSCSAWIERVDGYKTWARGELVGPEGVTAEAEGLFILPRWARERLAEALGALALELSPEDLAAIEAAVPAGAAAGDRYDAHSSQMLDSER